MDWISKNLIKKKVFGGDFLNQKSTTKGAAMLMATVFFLVISLTIILGIAGPILSQKKISADLLKSRQSFFLAEAGLDDVVYRVKNNKNYESFEVLSVSDNIVEVSVQDTLDGKKISAEGNWLNTNRNIKAELVLGEGVAFHYGVQVGDGGLVMNPGSKIVGNVYTNNSILGSNNAEITGSATVAGGINSEPSVEWNNYDSEYFFSSNEPQFEMTWENNDSNNFFATNSNNRDIAQSFVPTMTGPLTSVSVYLGKIGNPGNITLRITADNGNKPSTGAMASSTINANNVSSTPGWVTVSFNHTVNAGTKYWIVLDYNSNSSVNYWNWRKDSSNGYVGNTGKTTASWNAWNAVWNDVGGDLSFKIGIAKNNDVAQSFTLSESGSVVRLAVFLGKVGNPSSNLTLKLTTDNNGKPSSTNLATKNIVPATVGQTPSWVYVNFSQPPNLVAGNKYWIVMDTYSPSSTNYWHWSYDSSDGYVGHTGRVTENCCSSNVVWSDVGGDFAFQVWVGGANTVIQNMIVGEVGRANAFTNGTTCGSGCIVDNPPSQSLPISDGLIQDWKNEALAGGTCGPPVCDSNGNLNIWNQTVFLGPMYIPGNLNVSGSSGELMLTGNLWVGGSINLSNNVKIMLDGGYGSNSGIIITDDVANISNNVIFSGSGTPNSYVLLISDKDSTSQNVIHVSNNAEGVVFYANRGWIQFSNNASAKEATAYGITMSNNSEVIYESGLADISFSSGPSGGFNVLSWKEY